MWALTDVSEGIISNMVIHDDDCEDGAMTLSFRKWGTLG